VNAATLGQIALSTRAQFSSFGGIMLWDASQAFANGRYDRQVKNIITSGGGAVATSTPTTSQTTSPAHTTSPASTTKTSTTSAVTTTTKVSTGSCAGVAAWDTLIAYVGGSQVTSNGHLWQANWWSEADVPGGASGDWTDLGSCTSLAGATAKAATIPAAAATLTDVAHETPAVSAETKTAEATETGKAKRTSRVFRV